MRQWLGTAVALLTLPAAASAAPFLWRVDHGPTTHYLLGSIHLLPADAVPLPEAIGDAYGATRRLVFETNPAALESAEAQQVVARAALLADDRRSAMSDGLASDLARQLRRLGLPVSTCDSLRAWFCALTLELTAFLRADFAPQYGVDAQLHARGVSDGRSIAWLEPPDEHLRLLTDIPDDLGGELLAATLDELDDPLAAPRQLLRAWREDDTSRMAQMVEELRREHPDAYARLIGDRNRAWLAPLSAHLRSGVPVLVVVGAAHWVGPDGLVDLLQDAGFDVQAVP